MDSFWFVACVRAECRQVFFPCRRCDRGKRYCSLRCAHDARRASLRAAGRRYQHSRRDRSRRQPPRPGPWPADRGPAHLAALTRDKRRAHDLRGRDRLRQTCPQAAAFLEALALRGESLAPQITALLRLLDQYGASALDVALATALARSAVNAVSIAHRLDQRARAVHEPAQPNEKACWLSLRPEEAATLDLPFCCLPSCPA